MLNYEDCLIDRCFPEVDDAIVGINRYHIMRRHLMTADVIEWRSEAALGYAIRWFTKKSVNHTGGVYRFTDLTDEMRERVYTLEALPKGFYPNHLSKSLDGYKGKVYLLPLRPSLDQFRPQIAAEQWSMIGCPYDFLGLFKNALGYVSEDIRAVFCSEAIGRSFRRVGLIRDSYKEGKALRPGDFDGAGLFLDRIRIY